MYVEPRISWNAWTFARIKQPWRNNFLLYFEFESHDGKTNEDLCHCLQKNTF